MRNRRSLMGPSGEIVKEEPGQGFRLAAAILEVARKGPGTARRGRGRCGRSRPGGGLDGGGLGEEPGFDLVGDLSHDDRIGHGLAPDLAHLDEGLHPGDQSEGVVATARDAEEADRGLERVAAAARLSAEEGDGAAVEVDSPLARPGVEERLGDEEQSTCHGEIAGHSGRLREEVNLACERGRLPAFEREVRTARMASNDIVTLEDGTFDKEVLKSDIPVLVDFWAVWCGPCKAIAPVVEQIAVDFKGKVKVGKMDIDKHQGVAQKFNIRSIPTLLVFKGGKVVDTVIGADRTRIIESVKKVTAA